MAALDIATWYRCTEASLAGVIPEKCQPRFALAHQWVN
jgi:hypothetical protein